jgi:predicted nucleotidyltransferase
MLGRDDILERLRERQNEMATRFSVRRMGLFGSYLHGNEDEESDIDLIVDLSETTFDHYMDLKFYHETLFERPVDLVLSDTIKPRLKPVIQKEAAYV